MAALQEKDNQLERETMGIVEQFRRAEGEDQRAELREQITALAAEHFTVRQERRELEIKRLEAQLERLREALRKRSDDKDAVISRRVSQLTGEDDLGF